MQMKEIDYEYYARKQNIFFKSSIKLARKQVHMDIRYRWNDW